MSSGGQRRSLRILELEVRKAQELNKKKHDMSSGSIEDQYSQRRRRKKSKVKPFLDLAAQSGKTFSLAASLVDYHVDLL